MSWLLWLYPRRWRRRYADEFLALMEARPLSPSVVLDVLRGALDAWLHPELGAAPAPATAGSSGHGRFDKFTPRSRIVLQLAQQEAERLHQQIGSEHVLLGLLLEGHGVAAHVLAERGVQLDDLRVAILVHTHPALGTDPRRLGLSQDAKRAIELSTAEANGLRHQYLGTEHLLLGLVAEGQGLAAELLRQRKVGDVTELRQHIVRVLNESGPHLRPPRAFGA